MVKERNDLDSTAIIRKIKGGDYIRCWLHTFSKLSGLFNYLRIEYVVLIATVTHNYLDTHGVMMHKL